MAPPKTDIDLYTSGTPNGQKANIILEELGINYTVHNIEISKKEQKDPSFLKVNPNGRIPAIVDKTPGNPSKEGEDGFRVFESYALMQYLVDRYDPERKISFDYGTAEYWESVQWNVWMQSGLGPMQGQANHFYRYAPEKIEYGIKRYQTETRRLYSILDARLKEQEEKGQGLWLVGGKYSIADLNCFCWVNWSGWAGVYLDRGEGEEKFPNLYKWLLVINEREAVKKGLEIPNGFELRDAMKTKEAEEEYAKHHSNWVMEGQKEDQEKHK